MRVIFDIGHPAHFHLFKHVITTLKDLGEDVEIIARQKDCLLNLIEKTGWPYHLVKRGKHGIVALGWQNLKAFQLAISLARKKQTDFMIGTSIVVGPAARLTGATSLIFSEDDAKAVPLFAKMAYPVAHYIITPNSLKFENHGKKHLTYPGYHELAYLHPDRYTPNQDILKELGVKAGEKYFLIRLVSLTAHHDIGESGISTKQAQIIVEHLAKHGRVFISAETTINPDLQKYLLPVPVEKIFDVLAFAHMIIGDSQTMSLEAAVLGTPSLRCNSFVGRLSCPQELEHKYGLTAAFLPKDFDKLLLKMDEWLSEPDLKEKWEKKREVMLSDCIDLTTWILDLLNNLSTEGKRS